MLSSFISRPFNLSILIGVAVFCFAVLGGISARAQSGGQPVTGWAWSSNIGWISFDGAGYGVSENPGTGALSGYAWSSNIGWITFENNKLSGCPTAPCRPMVNLSTGQLSGWIRACAAFIDKNACSGALDPNSGGWDGWISLAGTATDGSVYGVTQDTATHAWSGFAWGSDTVGAISVGGTVPNSSSGGSSSFGVFGGCSGSTCTGALVPSAALYASPATIVQGKSTKLFWSSSNATSCTGTGFSTGGTTAGSQTTRVFDTAGEFSYQVVCTDDDGVPSRPSFAKVEVLAVLAPVNVLISANPVRVKKDTNTSVSWSAFGVDSCVVSGPTGTLASGSSDAQKSFVTSSPQTVTITKQSTFTITCQVNGAPVTDTVVVNLLPIFQEF